MKKRPTTSNPPAPTPPVDPDAHPEPGKWLGRRCTFLQDGQTLAGKVVGSEWIGFTARGRIPNYRLLVMGQSGRTATVDLVEQYTLFE